MNIFAHGDEHAEEISHATDTTSVLILAGLVVAAAIAIGITLYLKKTKK